MFSRVCVGKEPSAKKITKPAPQPEPSLEEFSPEATELHSSKFSYSFGNIRRFAPGEDKKSESPMGVQRALRRPIQAKLEVGAVDDSLELDADRVADQVMRMPVLSVNAAGSAGHALQGKCATCRVEEEDHKTLSRKESGGAAALDGTAAPPIVHEVLRSPGQPLDSKTRAFFEPWFGCDLSKVQCIQTHARQNPHMG